LAKGSIQQLQSQFPLTMLPSKPALENRIRTLEEIAHRATLPNIRNPKQAAKQD